LKTKIKNVQLMLAGTILK